MSSLHHLHRHASAAALAIAAASLAGCAAMNTASVQDVTRDGDKYLADNFSPAQLAPAVRSVVSPAGVASVPARFRSAHVTYRASMEEEGRVQELRTTFDYRGYADGLVAVRSQFEKNGIPYRQNFALTIGGVYGLRSQTVFLDRPNALLPYEAKELRRLDREFLSPVAGRDYTFDGVAGTTVQIVNFQPARWVCSAGAAVPASTIDASLSGNALPIDCATFTDGQVVRSHDKMLWLQDYGFALQRETANSRIHTTLTIESVRVER